jgi:prepilin-type N-terminal cleavage/methylation domain-containing protein
MSGLRGEGGFTLVEVLIASAILSGAFIVLLQFGVIGQRVARTLPDAADEQQRLRIAADAIRRDLLNAGAALTHGTTSRSLVDYMPVVWPLRLGARRADPELSFFNDRITIVAVPDGAPTARLSIDMPAPEADIPVATAGAGCRSAGLCGFEDGTRAVMLDTSNLGQGFELFSVTGTPGALAHGPPNPTFTRGYGASTALVGAVRQRTYYLDAATRRLMVYDGFQSDLPLVENVVSLKFAYFVEPSALGASRPPDGEANCAWSAGLPPVPVLDDLGGPVLAPASSDRFTDGPYCGVAPSRFDADLLRIRRVRVTIRAQVASATMRGSGADFVNAGASAGGASAVPDIQVTFDVTPRNMVPSR